MKERRMKRFLTRSLVYWGILAVKVKNKNIKKSVQKRAFPYKDWHEMLPSYFKGTLQQGQPPLLPLVYNYIKRGCNKFPTRRFIPVDFRRLYAQKGIIPTRLQGQVDA